MSSPELSVPVHDLDAGGKAFTFALRPAWLRGVLEGSELTPEGDAPGSLEVRASKSGNDVVIHGRLRAALAVPCARCLEAVRLPIDKDISALAVPSSQVKGSRGDDDEYEFSAGEADLVPFDGDLVVLDELVRDELVLEEPMIPLCSEDCPGIDARPALQGSSSTRAGADGSRARAVGSAEASNPGATPEEPEIDPRLAPLLRLKLSSSGKKDS